MNKVIAAIIASAFALSSVSGFAADAAKRDELTKDQRTEIRNRADRLTTERAAAPTQSQSQAAPAPKAKKTHFKKEKKTPRHVAKKAHPKT